MAARTLCDGCEPHRFLVLSLALTHWRCATSGYVAKSCTSVEAHLQWGMIHTEQLCIYYATCWTVVIMGRLCACSAYVWRIGAEQVFVVMGFVTRNSCHKACEPSKWSPHSLWQRLWLSQVAWRLGKICDNCHKVSGDFMSLVTNSHIPCSGFVLSPHEIFSLYMYYNQNLAIHRAVIAFDSKQ